ncbi:exocyst complex component Sec10 [Nitzschia inconspicua]|uniref:Exocyst complex component Sec10 n=1 Tax=Nitzschia inconspicua TaxID=303405 RepID=A0A9K3KGP0_9STRA|nr:exocyst complex component Sec10 [Nitzschia inconspicua]
MRRSSRDDEARQNESRRKTDAGIPSRGLNRSSSGGSLQRGISRTKSGSSTRSGVGRTKPNDNLRGGTRGDKGGKSKSQRGTGNSNNYVGFPSDVSTRSDLTSSYPTTTDVLNNIPSEYLKNPDGAEPILYYLPKMVASSGMVTSSGVAGSGSASSPSKASTPSASGNNRFPNLRVLLAAAEDDIRLHRSRQQAGKNRDSKLISTYKIETDPSWLSRQQRLNERELLLGKLDTERSMILKELLEGNTAGLTAKEATAIQLARWQRALELYVYNPPLQSKDKAVAVSDDAIKSENFSSSFSQKKTAPQNLDFLELLEKLMETSAEEEDMSETLAQAANMCNTLVDVTKQITKDATESILEVEDSYQIRLEAHELFCRNALARTEEIQNQFRINGRAALQIGNQLEFAESKRQRCESASVLIRRWWLMESLAEQETHSGEPLKVREEIRGTIPLASCRMDPLFTRKENSLEASRALRQLRQVVKSRGNAASANMQTGQWEKADGSSSRRFDLTADLIQRTSQALEERLLDNFTEIYGRGGTYEFTPSVGQKPRGAIQWQELRRIAQACWLFEGGRNLHEAYVDAVVATRLPELFESAQAKRDEQERQRQMDREAEVDGEEEGEDKKNIFDEEVDDEIDMDSTRSQLSSLFHRVSEVFTQEFQLIAHVFDYADESEDALMESVPLIVARGLCSRVIGDPRNGLQARISELLDSIDRRSDFDTGAKKLDTFVVIHEKAAGLFGLLKDAAERLVRDKKAGSMATNAAESLKVFLNSQDIALNNSHRNGYLNLELRLLHHECCAALDQAGCILSRPVPVKVDQSLLEKGILEEYRAPLLPLDKASLKKSGFKEILTGPLKASVLRQPLIHATDSLARARLMFGNGRDGGESAARVVTSIYNQICTFYGQGYLYPLVEALQEMLKSNPPIVAPQLPFDEEQAAHDLGVDPNFWVALERVHSAAKSFDREMWAESRKDSNRVWDILTSSGEETGTSNSMSAARECRLEFFTELENRGEDAILKALDTLSAHMQWILVTGSEAAVSSGTGRIFNQLTGQSGGPYAITTGALLEAPNSPAVKSLTYCLRVQFVHIQAALTPQSLSAFWTALSMRLYDILITRLLQNWYVSTNGAVILARDVEALRSVCMLAGPKHGHWDILRELLTLYMTPPDALKIMLVGPEGDPNSGKGLFGSAGREQSLVFMSRRVDYKSKTKSGLQKSNWVMHLLNDLHVRDPTDSYVNVGMFTAGRK